VISTNLPGKSGRRSLRFEERYRLKGLSLGDYTEIRFEKPVDQIYLLVASFGKPPNLTAYKGEEPIATVELSDRPRQLELAQLLGYGIERVVIEATDEALLAEVRYWVKAE
jgi:hypothetical protein